MNIVADEDVDGAVVQRLRDEGHEVIYVAELSPGVTDDDVVGQANGRGALLITADKDFGSSRRSAGAASPSRRNAIGGTRR